MTIGPPTGRAMVDGVIASVARRPERTGVTGRILYQGLRNCRDAISAASALAFASDRHPLEPKEYSLLPEHSIAYLVISKVACSSIKAVMLSAVSEDQLADDFSVHRSTALQRRLGTLSGDEASYYKFTFVRNPFARLVSAYVNKFETLDVVRLNGYSRYLNGIISLDISFAEFCRLVAGIPDRLAERHFKSQYSTVYDGARCCVDFVGKFDNLRADFSRIPLLGERACLPHFNRSQGYDFRSYYTRDLVRLVADRYRNDIEAFGYHGAAAELDEYCRGHDIAQGGAGA